MTADRTITTIRTDRMLVGVLAFAVEELSRLDGRYMELCKKKMGEQTLTGRETAEHSTIAERLSSTCSRAGAVDIQSVVLGARALLAELEAVDEQGLSSGFRLLVDMARD
jgi:hypothetical protein